MPASQSDTVTVESLAEEYLARLRSGDQPSIGEFQEAYPEFADEIAVFFPALRLVENYKPTSQDALISEPAHPIERLERLGDFRIVREIGRGGMGIVYLAEQESLGRIVAVKVLPHQTLLDAPKQKRFFREARAAAQLHHTNIVPVFGVGEQDGLHYYVMQYIPGLSLDRVVAELRRRRQNLETQSPPASEDGPELSASQIVESLLPRPFSSSSSGIAFWHSIARLGMQAADALQYAHHQGIIHRDIKPGNLLLDAHGALWITDFGLAKVEDDENLTYSGDFVGTLRYMAPEQFSARADARSDIYALGLTLYELLALRPAFDQVGCSKLVRQVTTEIPKRLRSIDRRIPPDLETIVHKAIDHDPSRRFQSAAALAEDLSRFVKGMPIHARRISPAARLARWMGRNPATAALLVLLTFLAVGSPAVAIHFGRLVVQANRSNLAAEQRLYQSKRSEATASRFSGRPGQHFTTIESLATAAELRRKLRLDPQDVDRMRDDAIAALALPDLQVEKLWTLPQPGKSSLIHFDANLEHYTTPEGAALTIRQVKDNTEVARLPLSPTCEKARFSPNGQWISLTDAGPGRDAVEVWDWRRRAIVYRVGKRGTMFASDFSPDNKLFAVGHEDASVSVHDLQHREEIATFQVASTPIVLAFHPTQPRLAVNCQTAYCTQIWDLAPVRHARTLVHPSNVFSLAWDPQGRFLGSVEGSNIHLWDLLRDSSEPLRILKGHTWVVSEMQFHPSGRLLYSHCWREGKTRVWDTFRGRQLFACEGFVSRFLGDGRQLAFRTVDQVGIWRVATGDACIRPSYSPTAPSAAHCQFNSDGSLLATAGPNGVHLWNTSTWELLADVPGKHTHSVCFDSENSLLAAHEAGLSRYPLENASPPLRLGTPERIALPEGVFAHHIAQTASGETLLVDLLRQPDTSSTGRALLIDQPDATSRVLQGDAELRFVAICPEGRWAATGTWQGADVTIWDVAAGTQVRRLPTASSTVVAFSPHGKWLVTASISELAVWQVGTWKKLRSQPRSAIVGAVALSPDSQVIAATTKGSSVELIEAVSGRTLATLTTNDEPAYVTWLAFSPGGGQLAVCCGSEGVRVWDLRQLRGSLRRIGLDWPRS